MELKVEITKEFKEKPADESKLGFGKIFSDHMFIMQYDKGIGWHDATIKAYGDLTLSPAAKVLHYSQEAFEGTKAYVDINGKIRLFRPEKNFERMNNTVERLCMPRVSSRLTASSSCLLRRYSLSLLSLIITIRALSTSCAVSIISIMIADSSHSCKLRRIGLILSRGF